MTSSTSSSEQRMNELSSDDAARHRDRRRVAVQTLLLGGGALLLALCLVRSMVAYLQHQLPSPFSIERIKAAAEALPAALEAPYNHGHTIYVLGSSLVAFGFSPEAFDRQLSEHGVKATTYNFGYGNADPSIHWMFAQKLVKTFGARPDALDLVVFEFTPFQATRARELSGKKLDSTVKAIFSDRQDLLTMALTDPKGAIDTFNIKYIRDGVPSDAITAMLGKIIPSDRSATIQDTEQPPVASQALQLYQRFVKLRSAEGHPGEWFAEDRGGLPVDVDPETHTLALKVTSRLQNPQRMASDRLDRLHCCDAEELNFSEALVGQFISAVKEAQKVSKRVDVLLMPRNQDVIRVSEEGRLRLRAVVDRIRQETGAEVVDFSERPVYAREEFFDSDHLSLFGGRLRFSRELADHYAAEKIIR